uniref:Uncharacterized protein n=1 Tax=Tanacetum cinerariifolium TaxID=118510 RepID=A0A6L2M297_TANCI|nr:hypothetical protein [Tanacetum cinerariifolium]
MEIKKLKEVYGLDADMEYDPEEGNLIEEAEIAEIFRIESDIFDFDTPLCKAYEEHKNAWIYEWNKDVSWKKGDIAMEEIYGMIRIRDEIYFEIYEWYQNLKECELKDEALNYKAMLKESMNVEEESSDDARTHHSPRNEWEDFEHANHI